MTFRKADTSTEDDGPFMKAIQDTDGVIKHELYTYRIKDGVFTKEVTTRRYLIDDYIDNNAIEPMFQFETEEEKETREATGKSKKSKGIPRD